MYFSFQQTQSAELVPEILCQNSSLSFDLFLRQFTLLLLLLLAVSLLSRPKYLRFFKSQHVWAIFFFATQENNMNFTTIIIIMVDFFFFLCVYPYDLGDTTRLFICKTLSIKIETRENFENR